MFIYRFLMFKMRYFTHFRHFLIIFKHFNAQKGKFYREIVNKSIILFIFAL